MATGDNFDTTKPGEAGGLTGRTSGHGFRYQNYMGDDPDGLYAPQGFLSDTNLNHPCNAGCGCKEVGKFNFRTLGESGCLLPPELTVNLVQSHSRDDARNQIEQGIAGGYSVSTFHLKYFNKAWRGRRCCQTDPESGIELCDPCEVTTHLDGSKSECSYFGKEGTGREAPVGIPDDPRFITSRLETGSRLGMCLNAKGDEYENIESTKTGQMGEDSCLDSDKGGANENSWTLIGKRGCIENGDVVPKKDPHCYFLDPNIGSSAFGDPLPTGWFNADDTLDNEASCEIGDALVSAGEPIGRCVCVRNCENAINPSIEKAQDEIWDGASSPSVVFSTKTECENRFQLCIDSSNDTLQPSHTDRLSCINASSDYRWVDDEFVYGERNWYQARCISFDAANALDEDKSPDGWRLAKDCERNRGSGYFPIAEANKPFQDVIFEKYECRSSGICWDKNNGENISKSEGLVDKRDCLLEGDCHDQAGNPLSLYDDNKSECLSNSGVYTEKNAWKPNIWTTKWLNNAPDDSGCCSGASITEEKSGAHQPSVGGTVVGQDTCVNCYEDVILMDVSDINTGLMELLASEGVGPDELGADGAGRGQGQFALIWRGCGFCGACHDKGECFDNDGSPIFDGGTPVDENGCAVVIDATCSDSSLTAAGEDACTANSDNKWTPAHPRGTWIVQQGGEVKILFLPMDQILNCSNPELQHKDNEAYAWANPRGYRPDDMFTCHDVSCGGKPRHNETSDDCEIYLYEEGAAAAGGIEPDSKTRSIYHPGEFRAIALNMQQQPYKLTESKQCDYKSYAEARADQDAISACLGLDCEIKDLPYWFDNDIADSAGWCKTYKAQWDTIKNKKGLVCSDRIYDNETDCDDNVGSCLISETLSDVYKNRSTCESKGGVWSPGSGWGMGGLCLGNRVSGEDCCGNNLHPYCNYCGPCAGELESIVGGILSDPNTVFPTKKPGSLDYWGRTGLYPSCDVASYISETCYGTQKQGTIEFASNTKPIVIKSTGHGLKTGDAVRVDGVSGNFAANILTNGQVEEIQWDTKKGSKCKRECDSLVNPKDNCVTYPWATPPGKETPLPLWVIDVLDSDHFALKDCNGRDSDGRVQNKTSTEKCDKTQPELGYGTTGSEADPLTRKSGSQGEVPVWEACPHTGRWELYSNPAEPVLTDYHLRGFGFFRENDDPASILPEDSSQTLKSKINDPQDWYVDISAKEVCPTCCDHWMPTTLTATVTDPTTTILDYTCGVDCNGDKYEAVEAGYMGSAHCDPIGYCVQSDGSVGGQKNKAECDAANTVSVGDGGGWVEFNTQSVCETKRCWSNGDENNIGDLLLSLTNQTDCIDRDLWPGVCKELGTLDPEFTTIDTCEAKGGDFEWIGTHATNWRGAPWTEAGFVQFTGPDGLPGLKFGDGYCCDCDDSCSNPEGDEDGLTCGCRKCSERSRFLDKPVCRSSAIDAHTQAQQVDSNGDPICKDDVCCSCDCCPGEGKIAQAGFSWPTANKWISIEQYKAASRSLSKDQVRARQVWDDNGCGPAIVSHEGHGTGLAPGGKCNPDPQPCVPFYQGGECGLEEVHTHWICCLPLSGISPPVPPLWPPVAPFGVPFPYTTKTCKLCVGNLCCDRDILGTTPGFACIPPFTTLGPQNWYIKGTNQEGCTGFFNYRDLKCEEDFICVDNIPGEHACKQGGMIPNVTIEGGGITVEMGGSGDTRYSEEHECMGIDNPYSATGKRCQECKDALVTGCDHFKRDVKPGCPGLGETDVPMHWDGYRWLSEWTPLKSAFSSGNVRRLDSYPDTGCEIPPFVGGMQCHHHRLPEWMERGVCVKQEDGVDHGSGEGEEVEIKNVNSKTACEGLGSLNSWREPWHPPFCQESECNFCGDCETSKHQNNKPPGPAPCPTLETSAYYIQLELGCGNALDPGGHGTPTFDSYYEHGLNIKSNITTCRYNNITNAPCPNPLACGNTISQMGPIVPHRSIPGHNCGPTPPCTECCDFVRPGECFNTQGALTDIRTEAECNDPFGNGLVSTFAWSPPPEDGCGRCATFGANPAACLDLQGEVPSVCGQQSFRKTPQVLEVVDVQYAAGPKIPGTDEHSDKITARSVGGRPCVWFEGDTISIGLADRTAAETGGKYFHSNNAGFFTEEDMYPSSTDILSASSEYPKSTYLVVPDNAPVQTRGCDGPNGANLFPGQEAKKIAISMPARESQPDREGNRPNPDVIDHYGLFDFYVADATQLTGHNRSIDRHLYRGAEDTRHPGSGGDAQPEPWPYGDRPYPTARQSESTVPNSSVFHHINKAVIGPLTNMFRIGKRLVMGNVFNEEHILNPTAEIALPPVSIPLLEDGTGGGHLNEIRSITEVWGEADPDSSVPSHCAENATFVSGQEFKYLAIETEHPHDLIDGEKIWLDGIWSNQGQCTFDSGIVKGLLNIPKVTCKDHNGDVVVGIASEEECKAETNKCFEGVCRNSDGDRIDVATNTAKCVDEFENPVAEVNSEDDCISQGFTWDTTITSSGQCSNETGGTGSWEQEVLINDEPLGSTTNQDICESQAHRTWVEGSFVDEGTFNPKACYDQDGEVVRDYLSNDERQMSEKNYNLATDARYTSQECGNSAHWTPGVTSTTWENEQEYIKCLGAAGCAIDALQFNEYTKIKVDKNYCLSATFGLCKDTNGDLLVHSDDGYDVITEKMCKTLGNEREKTYEWVSGPGVWENSGFFVEGCVSEEIEQTSVADGGEAPDAPGGGGDDDSPAPGGAAGGSGDAGGAMGGAGGAGGGDEGGEGGGAGGADTQQQPETTGNCNKCYLRCIQKNMFFDSDGKGCDPRNCCGREDFCPSSELNGEWVVEVIDDTHFIPKYPVFAEPEHPLKSKDLLYDSDFATTTTVFPLTTKDLDDTDNIWNEFAKATEYGNEVGIGKSAGSFGEFYDRVGTCVQEINEPASCSDPSLTAAGEDVCTAIPGNTWTPAKNEARNVTVDYPTKSLCEAVVSTRSSITYDWKEAIGGIQEPFNGDWTRHGGVFRIVVGSHDGTPWSGMDCKQAGTKGPVNLDFWFSNVPEACCNIHSPLEDNACAREGYPGYGPSSHISGNEKGAALFVNIHE